ncbi:aminoglycoside phosphotransferase (APT) family kinase protein [Streptomyces griseochromogenes]|uniref:Aminoglycoside phosphotransferase (APT) family kinase protein n=1 Tax=Streptomyces griseochromogenes TaxID=68214 RepID=A0A1B1B7H0_9ACTN|nr:aminoglycoside phosphotransferase family protein [Streptomyces griseochromogenes]ANP54743.1 phosphotransferase enzyme family protein [Streptomyces griseochromogenes]MBP2048692.1 aminoglycoside phosphotransferase (APT) family kinase protein [Streptomyces griseochromogenes]
MTVTGRLLGSGRSADVYEIDEGWVLRRDRDGWGDAAAEGAVMEHVRRHGYPVPRVRPSGSRTDLVMERLEGPTMLGALAEGRIGAAEGGTLLAGLLRRLHAVPGRDAAAPDARVLHLDLHPDNVMLTSDGPRVIDWSNTEDGEPALDWGMSAVILAQVAVVGEPLADGALAMLTALLADSCGLTDDGLTEALRRRAANPTMSRREIDALGDAERLIRTVGRLS